MQALKKQMKDPDSKGILVDMENEKIWLKEGYENVDEALEFLEENGILEAPPVIYFKKIDTKKK